MNAEERYLAAHLEELLAEDQRVHEPELDVEVSGRRVIVSGVVPTDERRLAVASTLRERCPDLLVDNATTVADYPPEPEPERLS